MTFWNHEKAYCLHIVKRRDTARKSILHAKTEPEAEKSWQTKNLKLTFQNASSLYWQAWFSHAEVQDSQLCTLTLTILRPHFDYLAHRLRVFYTAFPRCFRHKKGNLTPPGNTSRYVSRCYTNHDNSSVRQRQPLPWFLRVSRRFENTIYCRFRAEEPKYQNVSYEQQNNDKASASINCSLPGVYTSTVHMLVKLHTWRGIACKAILSEAVVTEGKASVYRWRTTVWKTVPRLVTIIIKVLSCDDYFQGTVLWWLFSRYCLTDSYPSSI